MVNRCSIIMYHYVRELSWTRYPQIRGLRTSEFKEQLAYLQKYYCFVSAKDLIASVYEGKKLPANAVWLTFDDGFIDHYENVFPLLDRWGIEGGFFVPVKAIAELKVLDVHKLHFILAAVRDIKELLLDIEELLKAYGEAYRLDSPAHYFEKLAKESRFDSKEIIYVKRLLQMELPTKLRHQMIDILFRKYVSEDEQMFSHELYMNEDHLRCMLRHGMYIGAHGNHHEWMDTLSPEQQAKEIDSSLNLLKTIGSNTDFWIMNYPYGAYNDSLIHLLRDRGCKLALSTRVAVAELSPDNAFILPRLDTNDFPKDRNAAFHSIGDW